jgi:hypothetical protein
MTTSNAAGRERPLPPTHYVERKSPTVYVMHFPAQPDPGSLVRCLRRLREYEFAPDIFIPRDGRSLTATLETPDNNLAMLRWLGVLFKPTRRYVKILRRTAVSLVITPVYDRGDLESMWPLVAVIAGLPELIDNIEAVFLEHGGCVIKFVRKGAMDEVQLRRLLEASVDTKEYVSFEPVQEAT